MENKSTVGNPEVVSVVITENHQEKTAPGTIRIQHWDEKTRLARAAKFWGYCWAGAFAAIFIPLVHFVLVPALLIAGPVLGILTLRKESVILGGEGKCPACRASLPLARSAHSFPASDLCTACQTPVSYVPYSGE